MKIQQSCIIYTHHQNNINISLWVKFFITNRPSDPTSPARPAGVGVEVITSQRSSVNFNLACLMRMMMEVWWQLDKHLVSLSLWAAWADWLWALMSVFTVNSIKMTDFCELMYRRLIADLPQRGRAASFSGSAWRWRMHRVNLSWFHILIGSYRHLLLVHWAEAQTAASESAGGWTAGLI